MDEKASEYWRWDESTWRDEDVVIADDDVVTAGIDIGSTSSQGAVLANGRLVSYSSVRTGNNSVESAERALDLALKRAGVDRSRIAYTVATGYGRVNAVQADATVTEIACHAKGANYAFGPEVRTILDMGGQDCKAIRCDEKGNVVSFLMNDKCAAGTGRGMEAFADLLHVPIGEIGMRSFQVEEEPEPVSSTCVVYAKTEAEGLLRKGWSKNMVLAAYCSAMAKRVCSLLRRNGVEGGFAVTGGIAKNSGVVKRVERDLGVRAMQTDIDTQAIGAIGAGLFALRKARRRNRRKQ